MIKLIITDIGGVLIKTDEAIITCIEHVFKEKNIPLGSKASLLQAFGASIYDYIYNYLPQEHKDKAQDCYKAFKEIYPQQALHLMHPYEGINETLHQLQKKGTRLAVLSCMIQQEVQANLSLLNFTNFDLIYSLEDYTHKRPDPKGLLEILQTLKVQPEETLYVGDTVNDIKMAKNAHIQSVAVRTGAQDNEQLQQAKPDYLLKSFKEIIKLIEIINTKKIS